MSGLINWKMTRAEIILFSRAQPPQVAVGCTAVPLSLQPLHSAGLRKLRPPSLQWPASRLLHTLAHFFFEALVSVYVTYNTKTNVDVPAIQIVIIRFTIHSTIIALIVMSATSGVDLTCCVVKTHFFNISAHVANA